MYGTVKPGTIVHLLKGHIHLFRKPEKEYLPTQDCHAENRKIIIKGLGKEPMPLSIALPWDNNCPYTTNPSNLKAYFEHLQNISILKRDYNKLEYPLDNHKTALYHLLLSCDPLAEEFNKNFEKLVSDIFGMSMQAALPVLVTALEDLVEKDCQAIHDGKRLEDEYEGEWGEIQVNTHDEQEEQEEQEEKTGMFCYYCRSELFNIYIGCTGCRVNKVEEPMKFCNHCYRNVDHEGHHLQLHFPCDRARQSTTLNSHFIPAKAFQDKNKLWTYKYEEKLVVSGCAHCRTPPDNSNQAYYCTRCNKCVKHCCMCHAVFEPRARWCRPKEARQKLEVLKSMVNKADEQQLAQQFQSLSVQIGNREGFLYMRERLETQQQEALAMAALHAANATSGAQIASVAPSATSGAQSASVAPSATSGAQSATVAPSATAAPSATSGYSRRRKNEPCGFPGCTKGKHTLQAGKAPCVAMENHFFYKQGSREKKSVYTALYELGAFRCHTSLSEAKQLKQLEEEAGGKGIQIHMNEKLKGISDASKNAFAIYFEKTCVGKTFQAYFKQVPAIQEGQAMSQLLSE